MEESKEDDNVCPVCVQLYYKPSCTPCNHHFCLHCLTQLIEVESRCPLCRTDIPSTFVPVLDVAYNSSLLKKFPEKMKSREEEIKAHEGKYIKIKFLYGNSHTLVQPQPNTRNSHEWKVYVKPARPEAKKYIDSVIFRLHNSFSVPVRTVNKTPFEVKAIGWGYFTIPITIKWKKEYELKDKEIEHLLCFDGTGKELSFFLEIERSKVSADN